MPGSVRRGGQRRLSDPGEVVDGLPDEELPGARLLDEELSVSASVPVLVLLPDVDG